MTAWPSYSVVVLPEGLPLPVHQVMCIYRKMQKKKNKKRLKTCRLRACENSDTLFARAKLGYFSVVIIADPQEICKSFLEFFREKPAFLLRVSGYHIFEES